MFERIPVKKDTKIINVDLWIGTDTLRNYKGQPLWKIRTVLYNQVSKVLIEGDMKITVIADYYNESILIYNTCTILAIAESIDNLLSKIEERWTVER